MPSDDDDELGTVRWFGRSWDAPVNDPALEIPIPIGTQCARCNVIFEDYHRGVRIPFVASRAEGGKIHVEPSGFFYYHLDCWMYELGIEVTKEVLGP